MQRSRHAWRWASDYSRIIWLQAETPETLGRDFDTLADKFGLFNGNKPAERAKVIDAVCEHLENNPGWLLIFDNAPEPRALERVVPRKGGQVVFTSRYSAWGKHARGRLAARRSRAVSVAAGRGKRRRARRTGAPRCR
jgi:hypothetical protein